MAPGSYLHTETDCALHLCRNASKVLSLSCKNVTDIWTDQISVKLCNIGFRENPFSDSRGPFMCTDGHANVRYETHGMKGSKQKCWYSAKRPHGVITQQTWTAAPHIWKEITLCTNFATDNSYVLLDHQGQRDISVTNKATEEQSSSNYDHQCFPAASESHV
jgi:hypothetical protein